MRAGYRDSCRPFFPALICALAALGGALPLGSTADGQERPGGLPRHAVLGASGAAAPGGVEIIAVRPGSAAEQAGLRVGDVVHSIGGAPVSDAAQFLSIVKPQPTGRPSVFIVERNGKTFGLRVVLSPATDEHDPNVMTRYGSVKIGGSLRRTLVTFPVAVRGPRAALLLVGGIGCYSVDVASDPQDAYLRLAHDLGARGFVVMRLEKSGVGDSQGPPCATTDFNDELRSYAVALRALRADPDVQPAHIYVLGHSIGSAIAPRLAIEQPVAGVIMLEGFGRNWVEYELWNLRRQLELGGDAPDQVDAKLAEKEICMHRLLIEKEPETAIEQTMPSCKEHNAYPAPATYLQEVAALDVAEPWTKLSVPVLAVYGTGDFVTAEADHKRVVDIVNARHPGSAVLRLVPGMDHHLDVAGTPQQAYDLRVKDKGSGPYDEQLSATILDWLCKREQCPGG